jgi:hypothetical protein
MTRWVCFDEPAADAVRSTGGEPSLRGGDALLAAMREPGNSVVIMPSAGAQNLALVSVIKREKVSTPALESAKPARIGHATGFLGLTDEPGFEDEAEKRPWWKRWS